MRLILAESAGFCFGVKRSVEIADELLREGRTVASLGELIHNEQVVREMELRGLRVIQEPAEASPGETVIIRAHGVSERILQQLKEQGSVIVDATCPKVKAIHAIVKHASDEGRFVIIIGMRRHPEVEGIRGWCKDCEVFEDSQELEAWLEKTPNIWNKAVTMVVQTTQTQNNFEECAKKIKKRCTNAKISDTICSATSTRQKEAAGLSAQCEAVVVIGGKHSANSIHLAEICSEHCDRVQFIESADELDLSPLKDCETVGL